MMNNMMVVCFFKMAISLKVVEAMFAIVYI
jgi:hypothetical protein